MTEPDGTNPSRRPPPDSEIPISRALGRFFGHLWKGVSTPADQGTPSPTNPTEQVRKTKQERPAEINGKPVILRRTTIEEIEFKDTNPQRVDL